MVDDNAFFVLPDHRLSSRPACDEYVALERALLVRLDVFGTVAKDKNTMALSQLLSLV
jgi:hypothetical protein